MRTRLAMTLLLSTLACGPGPRDGATAPGAPTEPPTPAAVTAPSAPTSPLSLAQGLSEQTYQSGAEAVEIAVAAAFFASGDQGRITTTGTVRVSEQGSSYEPGPSDRMQVYLHSGDRWTFEFIQQQGSDDSAEAFMTGDHLLHLRAQGPEGFEAEIHTGRQGQQRQATLRGSASSASETYIFDLSYIGTEDFESDSTGASYRADFSVAGTVRAPGFELAASERWRFELVSGTGPGAYTANTAERVQDGRLSVDGSVYDYRGLTTRRAFRDGAPTEIDTYWGAEGQVLKDGSPWGQAALRMTTIEQAGTGSIQFGLRTPDALLVLESWPVY